MQFSALVLALAFGSASAFMGARVAPRAAKTSAISMTTQEELAELAESNRDALGAGLGFWDPLGCSKMSFWTLSNEETIGYLRHAEIKHGRVASKLARTHATQPTILRTADARVEVLRPGVCGVQNFNACVGRALVVFLVEARTTLQC